MSPAQVCFRVRHSCVSDRTEPVPSSTRDEYLEAGADRLLTKPVLERNVRDIIARVRERKATAPPTPDGDMARNLADPMLAAGESDASTGGKTLS